MSTGYDDQLLLKEEEVDVLKGEVDVPKGVEVVPKEEEGGDIQVEEEEEVRYV